AALLRDAAAELEERNNDGLTPLGIACASGNWRLARFLLERGAKTQADEGTPALLAAAGVEEDDAAGVGLLLKHKARVDARDAQGRSALHEAASAGHVEIIQALLAAHADLQARDGEGRTPLLAAVAAGKPAAVQALLEAGADTAATDADGRSALDHAVQAGRWSVVALLDPDYPLPAAIADADEVEAVDAAAGASGEAAPAPVDPESRDGLQDSLVFAMLARGADGVEELREHLRLGHAPAGPGGLARFLDACVADDQAGGALERFALELMERGADPFSASRAGDPPLSLAVRLGWPRLVERLLAQGVDPATRDSRGMTALHLAAALGREQPLKLLVLHGASPELRAADGQTPLGVALSSGRRDLVDWLDWNGWPLPRRALRAS